MRWIRPVDASACSYRWQCSECGRTVYFNHGQNTRKLKGKAKCGYTFCPYCGAENEEKMTVERAIEVINSDIVATYEELVEARKIATEAMRKLVQD